MGVFSVKERVQSFRAIEFDGSNADEVAYFAGASSWIVHRIQNEGQLAFTNLKFMPKGVFVSVDMNDGMYLVKTSSYPSFEVMERLEFAAKFESI